jgi:hypothetical protein
MWRHAYLQLSPDDTMCVCVCVCVLGGGGGLGCLCVGGPNVGAWLGHGRSMGMEVCCTLGMLDAAQARELKAAGLTAYNHNLDTSRDYYPKIITTRTYDERLATLAAVRDAGLAVCSGGIIGLGEAHEDRVGVRTRSKRVCLPVTPSIALCDTGTARERWTHTRVAP